MPNWDAVSKLIGWAPGAAIEGLLGGIIGLLGFESVASSCATGTMAGPFGPATTSLSCVQTVFGNFYTAPSFAAMTGVLGSFLGIAAQLTYAALRKSAV